MSAINIPPFNEAECLDADPFAGDFGSPGDRTLSDRIVRARKGGECHECAQPVASGTWIRRRTDISEGQIATYRWCHLCCAAMAKSWTDHGRAWEKRAMLRISPAVRG